MKKKNIKAKLKDWILCKYVRNKQDMFSPDYFKYFNVWRIKAHLDEVLCLCNVLHQETLGWYQHQCGTL